MGKSLKSIIDPITDLFNSLLKGAFAVIVFAGGLFLVAKAITAFADIEWDTIAKAAAVMGILAVAMGALAVIVGALGAGLLEAAGAFLLFGAGLVAVAAGLKLLGEMGGDGLEKLTKIDASNLWSVAGAITAISGALAAFGVGQAAAGIGSFFANVLTMGQDSPVEQMEKMSKMGPGLVQAADGFSRIPGAVKQFAEADMEKGLNAMGKVSNAAKLFPQPTAAGRPDMQSLTPVTSQSEKAGSAIVNAPTTNSSTNVVNNNSSMVMPAPPPRNAEPTINSSWFRSYAPA